MRRIQVIALLLLFLSAGVAVGVRYYQTITLRGEILVAGGIVPIPSTLVYGQVSKGGAYTLQVFLYSVVNVTLRLSMSSTLPSSYGNLTWNLELYLLYPFNGVVADFSLHVASNAPDGFFNGTISILQV